jgi:methylmalonyl-CoA mutase, N-terminal domain
VAKIRAARRMFARMMRTEFGARDPRSWSVNITAHTSGASLVGHEPINNVIRGAVQAMALALAGVQSMEVSAFDEPFRIPSPAAHVVGIRTQQVIAEETDLMRFIDPLGGSYTMERLTNDLEAAIWDRVRDIEALGDPVELAEDGYFRSILVNGMTDFAADIDEGRRVMIGANTRAEKTAATDLLREVSEVKVEPSSEHIMEVRAWKRQRNYRAVSTALADIEKAIRDRDVNLMPAIIAAMRVDATMGEIADLLRPNGAAFGPNPLPTDG